MQQKQRSLRFAYLMLLLGLCATTVQAQSTTTALSDTGFKPVMANGRDCFSGPFASYDSFVSMLKRKNPDNPNIGANIHKMVPRAQFEQYQQQLHCESFVYDVDGVKVLGYLVQPKQAPAKSLPVLVYNRGGNGSYSQLVFMSALNSLMPLAAQGYVVLASNYRGDHNPMKLPPEQLGKDEFGGADVADVVAFKSLVPQIPAAKPGQVAMMGQSRGGMQSWLAARQWPELNALVIVAGVTDLTKERPDMDKVFAFRIPDYQTNKLAALQQRSVSHFLADVRADLPVLIVHGDQDERVDVSHAQHIDALLTKRKQPHELLIVPGANHVLRGHMPQVRQKIDQFIRQQLQ